MTKREEEIKNEAKLKCYDIAGEVDYIPSAAYDGFVMGVEWADKNPQFSKEKLINKACEWIQHNKAFYKMLAFGSIHTDWDKFIKEFRKAMLEEE